MKHSLIVSGLTWLLVGCGTMLPANHTHENEPVIINYDNVVSEPLNGLVPPPKLDDIKVPEGSVVDNPIEIHVERTRSYKEYIKRHVESAEQLLLEDAIVTTKARANLSGVEFNCARDPISQIKLPEAPKVPEVPVNNSDADLAQAAMSYAMSLEDHQTLILSTIAEGVGRYEEYCH